MRVALVHLPCHRVEELEVVDDAVAVGVNLSDGLLDLLTLGLLLDDAATAILVEQVEGFLDLVILLLQ